MRQCLLKIRGTPKWIYQYELRQHGPLACLISKNIYNAPRPRSWSVRFVPKTCQVVTKTVSNRRKKNFSSRSDRGKRVHSVALPQIMVKIKSVHHFVIHSFFIVFYGPLQEKQMSTRFFFIAFLECMQTCLQTFHFTIITNSNKSGFAFCPKFATICNSFLLSTASYL